MSKYTDQLEKQLQSMKITQDSYDSWLDNECTQRFMLEVELNLQFALEEKIPTAEADRVTFFVAERNASIGALENILNWKPSELEADE